MKKIYWWYLEVAVIAIIVVAACIFLKLGIFATVMALLPVAMIARGLYKTENIPESEFVQKLEEDGLLACTQKLLNPFDDKEEARILWLSAGIGSLVFWLPLCASVGVRDIITLAIALLAIAVFVVCYNFWPREEYDIVRRMGDERDIYDVTVLRGGNRTKRKEREFCVRAEVPGKDYW